MGFFFYSIGDFFENLISHLRFLVCWEVDAQKEAASILEHPFDVCGHVPILQRSIFQTQVVHTVILTLTQFVTAAPLSICRGPKKVLFNSLGLLL